MIVRETVRYRRDAAVLLAERDDVETAIALLLKLSDQLAEFPLSGERYRGNIRRRYLPRLRAHVYYQYFPRAKRIDLLRLWPAYRDEVG